MISVLQIANGLGDTELYALKVNALLLDCSTVILNAKVQLGTLQVCILVFVPLSL